MEAELSKRLLTEAKYVVQIDTQDFQLFHEILCGIFVREFGYALPGGATIPAVKGKDDKTKLHFYGFSHAASRFGIDYVPYHVESRLKKRDFHSISSSFSKKRVVEEILNEAVDSYFKQKNERPKIKRRIKSEIDVS